jgi:TPR repeat protein
MHKGWPVALCLFLHARTVMKPLFSSMVALLAAAGLGGCTYHPPGQANGATLWQAPPTGVVAALPAGVFAHARRDAEWCEQGHPGPGIGSYADFGACARVAQMFEHGATSAYAKYCGGHGGGHGDGHGGDHHDDGHHDDHGDGDHGARPRAPFTHVVGGGGGSAADGCPDGHGGYVPVGEPVPRNPAMAASLYDQTCQAGWLASCSALGRMLVQGDGIPADLQRATTLYTRACEGGNTPACLTAGTLFRGGQLPGGEAAAARAFATACRQGDAAGCSQR